MKFALTDDQASVLNELERMLEGLPAHTEPVVAPYSDALDAALSESGFLDIAREDGFGMLDAALLVERLARAPHIVEAAASAIVGPAIGLEPGLRPLALVVGDPTRPTRFLPRARMLVADMGDHALAIDVDPARVQPVGSLFAYPYGRLDSIEGLATRRIDDVATLRRRWRIALAAEIAGCMAGALALVVEHVKARHAFGRPLGSFQGIQHRLAMAAESAESSRWLALRAAWSDDEGDAAQAAGFAQSRIHALSYDLHQFSGAMGLTLEYPLHLWTYRLRALAGELGGAGAQARAAAAAAWPDHAA
ncbi:acyl-CoA dehydrogenase family protein [Luteimonas sp. SDU101]|uniref:acyl-CoA dehydrogenase family protein n=1 Tax=Luteimonas sp. SDU101 TaxID=3422593 RepID=UPI003EBCD42A